MRDKVPDIVEIRTLFGSNKELKGTQRNLIWLPSDRGGSAFGDLIQRFESFRRCSYKLMSIHRETYRCTETTRIPRVFPGRPWKDLKDEND